MLIENGTRILDCYRSVESWRQVLRFADSPSVTAVLSNSEAVVGEMVELQIKVSGSRDAKPPEDIVVNGLEIHATGRSHQFEMRNFTTTSSVTYSYRILPLQAGRFTIPSQTIQVGGKSLRTPELTLNVADSPGAFRCFSPSSSRATRHRRQVRFCRADCAEEDCLCRRDGAGSDSARI